MYGLWWILGIVALTLGAFFWLDRMAAARRRRALDLFAARNLLALSGLSALLALAGGIGRAAGVPPSTLVELQYYFSNRLRWEVGASLRALVGYAGAQPVRLLLSCAVYGGLGAALIRLHPSIAGAKAASCRWRRPVCIGVPALCAALLTNPLAKALLGLDSAFGYIASQGFFLLANPADMWHFHALAIALCCLVLPFCGLQYGFSLLPLADSPLKKLLLALAIPAGCGALLLCLYPVAGVLLYPMLIGFALALVCGCFDPPAAKRRRRAARYTPRENEILDLLGADMVWLDQVEPAEARALAQKMRDNGDCELISEIYEGLRTRGHDE